MCVSALVYWSSGLNACFIYAVEQKKLSLCRWWGQTTHACWCPYKWRRHCGVSSPERRPFWPIRCTGWSDGSTWSTSPVGGATGTGTHCWRCIDPEVYAPYVHQYRTLSWASVFQKSNINVKNHWYHSVSRVDYSTMLNRFRGHLNYFFAGR